MKSDIVNICKTQTGSSHKYVLSGSWQERSGTLKSDEQEYNEGVIYEVLSKVRETGQQCSRVSSSEWLPQE